MNSQPTRRQILRSTAALSAAGLLSIRTPASAAAPDADIHSRSVISHQPDLYHGWPTLARRRDGSLLLACSGGREQHVCPFGRVEFMQSSDDGRTWSWPRVLLDSPIDDRDAGILETSGGSLLLTTFSSLAYQTHGALDQTEGEQRKRWLAAHNRLPDEQRKKQLGTWMLRSTDAGVTWSSPYRVPLNSPHGPIQLSDNRLLYAGKELWSDERRIGVAESTDDGKSWNWLAEIPTRDGDDHQQYHELHAVETADNRIIAHIRNHNEPNQNETLQTESSDGGKTWSKPHPINVWGLPSHLLRLHDDRLLMTYGYRRDPFGNQARLSEDHGKTWSKPITLSDDGHSGDLGYPSTVQLNDRSLLTAWYEVLKDSPNAVLRQAHWSLPQ